MIDAADRKEAEWTKPDIFPKGEAYDSFDRLVADLAQDGIAEAGAQEDMTDPLAGLPTAQKLAIMALCQGLALEEIAQASGVSSRTIRRWRRENPEFQRALRAYQRQQGGEMSIQLRAAARHACDVLLRAVQRGDKQIAFRLADRLGLFDASKQETLDE